MTDWTVVIDGTLESESRSTILRKPYIKKEPFGKISMHEMNLLDMIEELIELDLIIEIHTQKRILKFLPPKDEN